MNLVQLSKKCGLRFMGIELASHCFKEISSLHLQGERPTMMQYYEVIQSHSMTLSDFLETGQVCRVWRSIFLQNISCVLK